MVKIFLLCLLLINIVGGCKMAEAVSEATNGDKAVEQRIREHAQQHLSLSPDKIVLKEMKADDLLPQVQQFYLLEKNVSDGRQYTYLVKNDQIYCSGVDGDFRRFLKDYEFLSKKEFDTKWFLAVARKFIDFRDMLVIDEERIKNPREQLKPFISKISAPILTRDNDGGTTFTFFTQSVTVLPVQKHEIKVSPDYKVTFDRQFVTP
jgi:hypothetical protein